MTWIKIAVLLHGIVFANACKGFKFVCSNYKNCGSPDQIIKIVDEGFSVNNKCEIMSSSCALVRPYKTATMVFKVVEDTITVFQFTHNLCSKKPKPEMVMTTIVGWGIPAFCPITHGIKYCYNGTKVATMPIVAQRMVTIFASSRTFKVSINITHDTGSSCFASDCKIEKKVT